MLIYDIKPTINDKDIITEIMYGNFEAQRIVDLRDGNRLMTTDDFEYNITLRDSIIIKKIKNGIVYYDNGSCSSVGTS